MRDDLARHLLATPAAGAGESHALGGYLTAWDAITYTNTVSIGGAISYTNLPVINPAALAIGPVLLLQTPAGPVIAGRIYRASGG